MKSISLRGFWYTRESEARIPGRLTFSPERGLRLSLMGAFSEAIFPGPERYAAVFGEVEHADPGRFVRLDDCLTVKTRITMAGLTTQELVPAKAFLASQPLDDDEMVFRSVTFGLEHLRSWAGPARGLKFSKRHESTAPEHLVFEWREPEGIEAPIGSDDRVRLDFPLLYEWSRHTFHATEDAVFTVDTGAAHDLNAFEANYLRPLHDFVSFALDHPVAFDDLNFQHARKTLHQHPLPVGVLFKPIFVSSRADQELNPSDMLFALQDTEPELPETLAAWFTLHRRVPRFCGSFFGLAYAPPRFVETRLHWALHSAVVLMREWGRAAPGEQQPPASAGDHDSVEIHALRWLLAHTSPLIETILGLSNAAFIERVGATVQKIDNAESVDGPGVLWLAEEVRWLLKAFVMLQVPPLARRATELLARNPTLNAVRRSVAAS